ncbi:MAG: phosphoribosylamine--glycine ligase [Planctomycetia bacterium]|nr:phosphoribosylamine--glycine ligase [Planctomycetia bacterium]
MNILIVGSGAREHALARSIKKSKIPNNLICFASNRNPGIEELSAILEIGKISDPQSVLKFATKHAIDLAIIGPEAPLANGVVDLLQVANIQCMGPTKNLAQIETSKSFTRDLMQKYNISGCPNYQMFSNLIGVAEYLKILGGNYVVKFDGLMGGKGVKVSGEHLNSHTEAIKYCEQLVANNGKFVIEEKLVGEEFSLMSFCDGENLIHMPPIQDHKRAYENDTGPNTGGMGSYNDTNQTLPFLTNEDIDAAKAINIATAKALKKEFGVGYKGILYGGFIATADGIKLIEYNARFGDPEAMNVLSLLESDFIDICLSITNSSLHTCDITFSNHASVCKYAVPEGYPDSPIKGKAIDISKMKNPDQLFFASVDIEDNKLVEAGSRTIAVVGLADTLQEAETIAENEIKRIEGPLFHRTDIGTIQLINKRIKHMEKLRA